MYAYLGEAAGARVFRYGVGFTQVGDAYQFDIETWPVRPAGSMGDCVFRTIDVILRHVNGYNVEITPITDGVAGAPVQFSGGPPPLGELEEVVPVQAPIFRGTRGNSLAARVRTLSVLGETEIVDVGWSGAVIRTTP